MTSGGPERSSDAANWTTEKQRLPVRPEGTTLLPPEVLATELYDEGIVTEVIRPAAIVPEEAAREIVAALQARSLDRGGLWVASARQWSRYDRTGVHPDGSPAGDLVGTVEAIYGAPTKYEITIYRATVTRVGTGAGWTVEKLCDEPLSFGGLTLATCPRATLQPPPKPFRIEPGARHSSAS